jgi:hypothetical protein
MTLVTAPRFSASISPSVCIAQLLIKETLMLRLSGWHIMLSTISIGCVVGIIFDPKHIIPLLIWTFMGAGICMGVEKLLGPKS